MNTIDILILYDAFMEGGEHIKSPEKVGWASKFDQDIRFQTLLNIGVKENDTILDWGCGLGHLLDFMKNITLSVNYTGIDINEMSLIETRKCFPDNTFKQGDIDDETDKYDWILASGIFSFGITKEDLYEKIDKALTLANKGVGFNCLLPLEKFVEAGFSTFHSNEIFMDLVEKYETLDNDYRVSLITDYTDDDFTIYIKKGE
jgi:cyclopropane fatty-acyl-phospholipid synthase-like methyltransferase